MEASLSRQRTWEAVTLGVPLGVSEGRVGVREGPDFGVEQQPQRPFLFIGITRLLGQMPEPGRGVKQAKRGALCPKPGPSSNLQAVTPPRSSHPCPMPPFAQGHH